MTNECELVIRWLNEPVEAACAFCKSKKPKKFEKGPVVSRISGELICLTCARKHNEDLWAICSNYRNMAIERNLEMNSYDLIQKCQDPEDFLRYSKTDFDPLQGVNLNDDLKLDIQSPDYDTPRFEMDVLGKCSKCTHTFQPKK